MIAFYGALHIDKRLDDLFVGQKCKGGSQNRLQQLCLHAGKPTFQTLTPIDLSQAIESVFIFHRRSISGRRRLG